jgi:hypothetical protein
MARCCLHVQVSWEAVQHLAPLTALSCLTLLRLRQQPGQPGPQPQALAALQRLLQCGLQRLVLGSSSGVAFLGPEVLQLLGAAGSQLTELHLGGNMELSDEGGCRGRGEHLLPAYRCMRLHTAACLAYPAVAAARVPVCAPMSRAAALGMQQRPAGDAGADAASGLCQALGHA